MYFKDIIGQEDIKRKLTAEARQGRIAHAQMLCGPEGCGSMPLALAYARYLLCENPNETDACGECRSCRMMDKLQHPDMHFAFPIYKKKNKGANSPTYCDEFLKEWRDMILNSPYFGMEEWMNECNAENQQLRIFASESDAMSRKLSLMSSQGGRKVLLMWMPEKMMEECANKILKLLEEPPAQTVFLLVSENPDQILQTIRSRTQTIEVPGLPQNVIEETLVDKFNILPAEAKRIARTAEGSMTRALRSIQNDTDSKMFFDMFVSLMRLAYMRKVKEMKQWSENLASLGRERQKNFLEYCQHMTRENFIYNFHRPELNYMSDDEANFAVKFAPFINENNVIGIMEELAKAQFHIGQNVNPKIVFFDLSLKMILLIKNR